MTIYSRQAFRAWLVTLPDQPRFWGGTKYHEQIGGAASRNCPIGDFTKTDSGQAIGLDITLACEIDALTYSHGGSWLLGTMTPSRIIALIDSLEEKTKETPVQQTTEWCNTPFQPRVSISSFSGSRNGKVQVSS